MKKMVFSTQALDALHRLIQVALAEDRGEGDITTLLLIPEGAQAEMQLVAREKLVACGMAALRMIFDAVEENTVTVTEALPEGANVATGGVLATLKGKARTLLTGERVALNLLQRLSGVATITAQYVQAVEGTKAKILDTRKTMPGMRLPDKFAVRAGGGYNHRMGLYDMVMIKDNHIALCGGLAAAVQRAREGMRRMGREYPVVVECDTLAQVEEAMRLPVERLLLDNMSVDMLASAVALSGGRMRLEASGGVTLHTVRAVAETGVDYISVGALTHSVKAADIGADILQ